MASKTLYPPILDSYMPAFPASDGSCKIYFSLSKYNIGADIDSLHVSIVKQKNNANMVNTGEGSNSNGRYRASGIILNVKDFHSVEEEDNLYYFTISNEDLNSKFKPGEIYKVQIRLSSVSYDGPNATEGQSAQLNKNASSFSEWSTVCTIKAIGDMEIIVPLLDDKAPINANGKLSSEIINTLSYTTLDISGSIKFKSDDKLFNDNEILYIYNIKLIDATEADSEEEGEILEQSGNLYANEQLNTNQFKYIFKTELKDKKAYKLVFDFTTNNYYNYSYTYRFDTDLEIAEECHVHIITIDSDTSDVLKNITSVSKEQEEGRIGLKLIGDTFTGNICIRRTDSKSNFSIQEDIKIIPLINIDPDTLDIIQDYTIESGVYYKYGVQSIDENMERSKLNVNNIPAMRDFEYSFLLGENNQQLKLKFNNIMNNYKIQVMENKTEPIGGIFPIITRNGALKYRIFPITGTISFLMDDNNLFCDRSIIYGDGEDLQINPRAFSPSSNEHKHVANYSDDTPDDDPTVDLINHVEVKGAIQDQYDYIYEREFRRAVLEFLHDGKPKLFKSPTEGNIIVRLTDISCTPNKTLDRMIYDFSSNGNEIAEATIKNYIKYKFLDLGEVNTKLTDIKTKIGQVSGSFEVNKNILYEIYNKYDSKGKDNAGYLKKIKKVQNVKITIEDKPLRYKNNKYLLGNKVHIKDEDIMILAPQRIYEIDPRISFNNDECSYTDNKGIYFLPDVEQEEKIRNKSEKELKEMDLQKVNAKIDFLYQLETSKQVGKKILSKKNKKGIGQIFGHYKAGFSIIGEISRRYYFEAAETFRELKDIISVQIEGAPGLIFSIKDADALETDPELHEINDTGLLVFSDLGNIKEMSFYGIRNKKDGTIRTDAGADMSITYWYRVQSGTYEKDVKGEKEEENE